MLIIGFGFLIRIFLSFYNGGIDYLPGTENDSLKFHLEALNYLELIRGSQLNEIPITYDYRIGWYYSVFLAYVYNYLGTSSLILGSSLSSVVWLISAIVLRNILIKFQVNKVNINYALFIYTFLFPIGIFYTTVTLREVYMLCLINFIILYIVKLVNKKKILLILKDLIFLTAFFILLAALHRSNVIFIVLFLLSLITYYLIFKLKLKKINIIFLGIIGFIIFYQLGLLEKVFIAIKSYQTGHFHLGFTRAQYYTQSEITSLEYSPFSTLSYILKNIYNYFFQPTFLKINAFKDVILLFENLLRFMIIVFVFVKIFKSKQTNHFLYIFLLMFFLSELPYSQATINWGTASRHHVQIYGLLIVLLFMPMKLKNAIKK